MLQGQQLIDKAKELGVDIEGDPIYQSSSGRQKIADEHVLQRRVIEAERSIRENRLWIIALVSAVASVGSAIAAAISAWKG